MAKAKAKTNGAAVAPSSAATSADEPRENIFLFYPNLIGASCRLSSRLRRV